MIAQFKREDGIRSAHSNLSATVLAIELLSKSSNSLDLLLLSRKESDCFGRSSVLLDSPAAARPAIASMCVSDWVVGFALSCNRQAVGLSRLSRLSAAGRNRSPESEGKKRGVADPSWDFLQLNRVSSLVALCSRVVFRVT